MESLGRKANPKTAIHNGRYTDFCRNRQLFGVIHAEIQEFADPSLEILYQGEYESLAE